MTKGDYVIAIMVGASVLGLVFFAQFMVEAVSR